MSCKDTKRQFFYYGGVDKVKVKTIIEKAVGRTMPVEATSIYDEHTDIETIKDDKGILFYVKADGLYDCNDKLIWSPKEKSAK